MESLIKMADSKGRITLGPEYAKKTFLRIEKNLVTDHNSLYLA